MIMCWFRVLCGFYFYFLWMDGYLDELVTITHQSASTIVSIRSQEGSQFCRGFGGIGGILRYQVDTAQFEEPDDDNNSAIWSDDDF